MLRSSQQNHLSLVKMMISLSLSNAIVPFRKERKGMVKDRLERDGLPHAIDAEKCVLGAILLENGLIDEAMEMLRPAHFYLQAHQCLYGTMIEVHRRNQPNDLITL